MGARANLLHVLFIWKPNAAVSLKGNSTHRDRKNRNLDETEDVSMDKLWEFPNIKSLHSDGN